MEAQLPIKQPQGGPEHRPYVGHAYGKEGIQGQRVAVMGYSHWGKEAEEGPGVTERVLGKVVANEWRDLRFFNDISGYFGFSSNAEFWPKVLFFNFIPTFVGDGEDRFAPGSPEQVARGQERLQRILDNHAPDKLFIFTAKGWNSAPKTIEEAAGGELLPLAPDMRFAPWGTYRHRSGQTRVIGLRHPQGARKADMLRAVSAGLALPLS